MKLIASVPSLAKSKVSPKSILPVKSKSSNVGLLVVNTAWLILPAISTPSTVPPTVILFVTAKLVRVPNDVIFGCVA